VKSSNTVPQPPLRPVIGNADRMDRSAPVQSLMKLASEYGPFFKLTLPGREFYVASSHAFAAELCDDSRFAKRVHVPLREIRAFAGDGLFTAYNDEPNWALAHTILMPAFGPLGVRAMFEDMVDIADQMFARWARFGPDAVIDVADNMTRLTLDTIALTAFNYRFNSFYREDMHPFVDAMVGALAESGARARRFKPVTDVMLLSNRRYRSDIDIMQQVARDLIARRKASPTAGSETDLLGRMLNGRDPRTGEGLSDKNIVHQMITFLIAGHETTSGLLSFVTYFLLKNPAVLAEARRQVDAVVGTGLPTLGHLAELRYLEQILMETLRLWPTAPLFGRYPFEDTVVGGKYRLTPDDTVLVLLPEVQRDPAVWGADAGAFRPERHTPENAERLPEHAWKPFGTGARACIGRPFAMQEAHLVLTMMLQRFEFAFEDPSYTLKVHETLTLKPENLRIRAWLRGEAKAAAASPAGANSADHAPSFEMASRDHVDLSPDAPKIHVLYGSNTGSAEEFANRLFAQAAGRGFAATLGALDEFVGNVPAAGTIVVVTASYEGQPPDNAVQFVPFIETLDPGSLAGREFAIFGCGNRQWARTWQAIPRRIEAALVAAGGQELLPRGEGDSGGDFFGAFDAWAEQFWAALADSHGMEGATANAARGLKLEWLPDERLALLRIGDLAPGKVVENRELTATGAANARSKRHIEFELPANQTYETGDYLAVLAVNPPERVAKALRLFGLSGGRAVVLHAPHQEAAGLPTGRPVRCDEILSSYVELGQPATRQQVARLVQVATESADVEALIALSDQDYESEVLGKRQAIVDLLHAHPSVQLEFAEFLSMLPPMRARQYSISSSPLWREDHVTLTVSVLDEPSLAGTDRHRGVASSYLAALLPGEEALIAVRPSQARFRPPADPATPMILICAGSGIAPFRGFLQERAEILASGQPVGRSLLYFGTNDPDVDYLYRVELEGWEQQGIVSLRPVFTLKPENGQRFVQDRLWAERSEVKQAFRDGAIVFVCGDGLRMAPAVRQTLIDIYREETGDTEGAAEAWADAMERDHGRYVADVFA